ncbi:type I DNA topoisomerase [Desulfobulbus elongatus]|uniref:type I DNA topoisomerase n=1 Tax=Desulfobulbus elongatus TaxID=53332 RepID=UPI00048977ED|nr:type I DNA topoisomerase [Desulfobulbus elongatus]
MNLVIVESPGKIKKIQSFLGASFRVMASVGHVRDLPEKEIGVEPPDFRPHYVPTDRGKDVLAKLASAAKDAEAVYLATDPDREGEAIAWHLEDALRLKGAKRITYTEITDTAVKAALGNARSVDRDLVAAQEGRRVLDRLVGYMVSPVLSRQVGERFSAGRVQSPAVRLVVDRERAIRNFRVTVHYGVELTFEAAEHITDGWKAAWLPKRGWLAEGEEYILDKAIAAQVAAVSALEVSDCQESESKAAPPAPFVTSTLQQAASAALKINPKRTMELAQKLYEAGHITYMRTDSPNLSEEAVAAIRSWAGQHDYPLPAKPRAWKSKAGAQEAHEAIRPTHIEVEEAGETEEEKALYRMIRLRAIASQLSDAVFAVRVVTLTGTVDGKQAVVFEARGRALIEPGWKALTAKDETDEDDEEPENQVPQVEPGRQLSPQAATVLTKKTKPPARYTEAALIKELEHRGIGRPSTYAAILDNITGRGYLQLEKRQLVPTAKGEKVVDSLVDYFAFLDYEFTRQMEEDLDRIAEGQVQYLAVVSAAHSQLDQELGQFVVKTSPKCPDCGKPLRHMVKADSKDKKGYNFWSCSGYPDCPATFADAGGVPGDRQEKKALEPSGFDCPKCGKPLIRRTGTSKAGKPYDFFGCSGFKAGCKASFDVKEDGTPDFEKAEKKKQS